MTATTELLDVEELTLSLNYYDELAIEKSWSAPFDELTGATSLRALLFIHRRRGGLKDKEAFEAAASVSLGELGDLFADVPEPDPDDPVTPAGKESGSPD